MSGVNADIKPGNCLKLENIPVGTMVHNIEINPGQGGKLVRAAGQEAQLMAKEGKFANLRLPSGELRLIMLNCRATIGTVGNAEYENRKTGDTATGCTVLIHGEIKAVLDQLMKENPEIKSYGQALAGIVDLGVSVLESQAQAVPARAAEAQENASDHKE